MKWYIVITIGKDYETYYDGFEVVRAVSDVEAIKQVKVDLSAQEEESVAAVFGPFDEKPICQELREGYN